MKKSLVTLALAFALAATAQQATPPAGGQQPAPSGQSGTQAAPTIKDPAEYNAYVTATQQSDPTAQAQAFEAFLQQYPNSVVKPQVLELLMAAYQKAGNVQKLQDAAQRLLQVDPNNLKALALLAFTSRTVAEQNGPNAQQSLADANNYAMKGLQLLQTAQKPAGATDEDWTKLKQTATQIFNATAGLYAFAQKDYTTAAKYLQVAVDAAPADQSNYPNIYRLAASYLEQNPINPVGLWYIARYAALTNNNPQVVKYGKYKYVKYHGDEDGWDQLVAQAGASPNPPAGWSVPPAPTPAEQAAKLCQTKQVKDMSFDEFQLIFTSGNQQCSDQVWNQIKDKPIQFVAKVVSVERNKLMLAATVDDIQNNKADVELTFPEAIPASLAPKVNEETQVQGNPTSFDQNPYMIHMSEGKLLTKKGAATAPAKSKTAPKKSPTRKKK